MGFKSFTAQKWGFVSSYFETQPQILTMSRLEIAQCFHSMTCLFLGLSSLLTEEAPAILCPAWLTVASRRRNNRPDPVSSIFVRFPSWISSVPRQFLLCFKWDMSAFQRFLTCRGCPCWLSTCWLSTCWLSTGGLSTSGLSADDAELTADGPLADDWWHYR